MKTQMKTETQALNFGQHPNNPRRKTRADLDENGRAFFPGVMPEQLGSKGASNKPKRQKGAVLESVRDYAERRVADLMSLKRFLP